MLPETHENDDHVDSFVNEVKITVTLNHPHLVRFVGVEWTSASDLYVVQELMKGGDLRSLLDSNLKSKNLLLNGTMEAKVTNFGTSHKRTYRTSTESKNATLWIAPEDIPGEMYSTDADMFLFRQSSIKNSATQ
ncbi:TKL protein kinase [Phytophthora cinnamomi]|uniref:TKL protein kinase n=1 Tax=Phytophthora cinnamomi TaxID=4785 RepID=UPI00355A27D1|nr:TKL protein kinase [Phytophthora cinnamomi]